MLSRGLGFGALTTAWSFGDVEQSGARPTGQAPDTRRLGLRRLLLAEHDEAVQDVDAQREDGQ